MQGQFQHKIVSSFLLWLDNKILTKGQAFTNHSSNLFKVNSDKGSYHTYAIPYGGIVSDSSISGANVMTGVYLNNTFITTGQSGFVGINYEKGHVYFNSNVNYTISGDYAVKDFNISTTYEPEEAILFKNKYYLKTKFPQQLSGTQPHQIPYPIIFVKDNGSNSDPFALGGLEQEIYRIRCIILSDDYFKLTAAQNILRSAVRTQIALFEPSEIPYNAINSLKSGYYNYTGVAYNKINEQNFMFIENATTPRIVQQFTSSIDDLNRDVFFNFVDFELSYFCNPRER